MAIKLELDFNDAISSLEDFKKEVQKRVAKKVFEKAQFIVPVDTGHLKGSGSVKDGTIKYKANYAVYVHEIPGHSEKGYKWLERAWKSVDVEAIARQVMAEKMMGGF